MSKLEFGKIKGNLLFLDCSGLTTISRYPMKTTSFHVFAEQGGFCDGDLAYFGRKGMGIIQIEPMPDVTVLLISGFKSIAKLYLI